MEVITVLALGFFGALVSIALWMHQTRKWPSGPYVVARLVIGAGAAFIWWSMGLPNNLNLFLAGFFADKIFESIKERYKPTGAGEAT